MLLTVLAYLGGVLAILSLCILMVRPFVFARAGLQFLRSTWPLLAGLALTCAVVATLVCLGPLPCVESSAGKVWTELRSGGGLIETAYSATPDAMTDAVTDAVNRDDGGHGALLPVEGVLPPLSGAVQWLNSPPLTREGLRGKVVVINVWTYSCINCLRALPYIKAWADKYKDQGLVVIGVHAPEFAFERNVGNVQKASRELGVDYPVAIDNDYAIWRGLNNEYWPAQYFIDAQGRIRHHNFGEGDYAKSEKVIQILLTEAGNANAQASPASQKNNPMPGVEVAADLADLRSPETYIGYGEADNFVSPGGEAQDETHTYVAPAKPAVNEWGLAGQWRIEKDRATLAVASGSIVYRFHARDLHLVLGPGKDGKPVRFRVSIDGRAPGDAHGTDVAADGSGTITEHRLYQMVRQTHDVTDHTFQIEFLDPGVEAYAFTFG
ncbi:thiol-disulfide isomerase/thioredoxin [Paraburkholderia sp. GAS41]|jgi:thiol-disulfide isomerase/thioredoxin